MDKHSRERKYIKSKRSNRHCGRRLQETCARKLRLEWEIPFTDAKSRHKRRMYAKNSVNFGIRKAYRIY